MEYHEKGVGTYVLDKTYPLEERMHFSSFYSFVGAVQNKEKQRKFLCSTSFPRIRAAN